MYFEVWCRRDFMEDAETRARGPAGYKGTERGEAHELKQSDGEDGEQPESVTLREFTKLLLLYGAPDLDIGMVAAGKRI